MGKMEKQRELLSHKHQKRMAFLFDCVFIEEAEGNISFLTSKIQMTHNMGTYVRNIEIRKGSYFSCFRPDLFEWKANHASKNILGSMTRTCKNPKGNRCWSSSKLQKELKSLGLYHESCSRDFGGCVVSGTRMKCFYRR